MKTNDEVDASRSQPVGIPDLDVLAIEEDSEQVGVNGSGVDEFELLDETLGNGVEFICGGAEAHLFEGVFRCSRTLCRYVVRCPVSVRRLHYDKDSNCVLYQPKSKNRKAERPARFPPARALHGQYTRRVATRKRSTRRVRESFRASGPRNGTRPNGGIECGVTSLISRADEF